MTPLKALFPALLALTCLTGCVYDEEYVDYGPNYGPRPVYYGGGYVERDVVVVNRPYYYDGPPRYYYGGRAQYYPQNSRYAYSQPPKHYYSSNNNYYRNNSSYYRGSNNNYSRDWDNGNDRNHNNDKKKSGDSQKKQPTKTQSPGARGNGQVVFAPYSGARDRPTNPEKDPKNKGKKKKDD
jgi:hypothetical protein